MQTREIPHEQWLEFFDNLSRRDHGLPTSIHVFGSDLGAQVDADQLPLIGISDDPKAEGGERITITLAGRTPTGDYNRSIIHPTRVMLELTDDGREESIEIESDDGNRTLVRLASPMTTRSAS